MAIYSTVATGSVWKDAENAESAENSVTEQAQASKLALFKGL